MGLQSAGHDLVNKQQQYPQGPSMLLQMSRFPILWLIFKIIYIYIYIYVCVYIYLSHLYPLNRHLGCYPV